MRVVKVCVYVCKRKRVEEEASKREGQSERVKVKEGEGECV